ncbi:MULTISPECIES: peptidoglycan DD-metalloendopeptidase family protein [unclassified Peribacillus]|nr:MULTISPECIES: M23 family metallopeptidase [unclassified Peribacillus]MCK1982235.1 M23 family metallopeptidase [Peribacillus sp. Aquil_B1]MCK2007413.1 M23 family metallopeptidase [Peribacillus sp. Aquil_B8]
MDLGLPNVTGAAKEIGKASIGKVKDGAIDFIKNKMAEYMPTFGGGFGFGSAFRRTSNFGLRKSPGGIGSTNHKGVDWAAPAGTRIPSQTGGRVSFSGVRGGYGNAIIVNAGGGYEHLYGHNSKNLVSVGQNVTPGQTIGLVGSTGNSTGPHVHYEVRKNGVAINPDSIPSFGGKVSGKLGQWISAGMTRAGVSGPNWMQGLNSIIQKESGGNPNATGAPTSTGTAKGLMQLKDFNYKGNPYDPVNNVYHGIRYIKGRYKTIEKAMSWWKKHHWYAKGTDSHIGGSAVLGDGGKNEPFMLPNGQMGLSPNRATLFPNLPAGTKVWSSIQDFIKNINLDGIIRAFETFSQITSDGSIMANIGNRSFDKWQQAGSGLSGSYNSDSPYASEREIIIENHLYMDSKEIGKGTHKVITEYQNQEKRIIRNNIKGKIRG